MRCVACPVCGSRQSRRWERSCWRWSSATRCRGSAVRSWRQQVGLRPDADPKPLESGRCEWPQSGQAFVSRKAALKGGVESVAVLYAAVDLAGVRQLRRHASQPEVAPLVLGDEVEAIRFVELSGRLERDPARCARDAFFIVEHAALEAVLARGVVQRIALVVVEEAVGASRSAVTHLGVVDDPIAA